jgi:two-component system cell cycle sensor histidine kinase/response regulator CckA
VLYAIDATEQKALELKFAQSHKMEAVGKLAGGVAHDFNNVLTAIIGFSDLLLQTHRQTDPSYRDIMNIKSSANRAAGLVRQLLAFSRRQTLQAEVLELGEVLTDLSALLNRAMGERIELKILSGRDLWYVKADKTQFEQVIINLAVNARDAMPDGGCLTIRTRNLSERESLKHAASGVAAGEYVLIEVEDAGVGMTPEVMAKIFEPFFSTKEVGKGTGLGLSTAYGIVKQTGGYIFADSEVGKGTTFRVYLPRHIVENEDEIAQPREKAKEGPRDLTGSGRVLLVEDEDVVRQVAARALSRQGYEVLEAGTGVEALEVMAREKGRVDIVVSDVIMPEMDGPTLLKELRKTNPGLKFIFISGYPDDAFKKSLDENEAYTFLPKPFTLPQLAAKVKEQLEG